MATRDIGTCTYSVSYIVPKKGLASELVSSIDADVWNEMNTNSITTNVRLIIPEYTAEYTFDNSLLSDDIVGANSIYSMFSTDEFHVGTVSQHSKIVFNKWGLNVSADNSYKFGYNPDIDFTEYYKIALDSPFIYVISEYSTGAILFMGVLNSVE